MADQATETAQATTDAAKGADTATEQQATDTTQKTEAEVQKAEETKGAEEKSTVPEKYELKLPEGSLLDASTIEKISAEAREKGLSNEDAQALLDRENMAVAAYHETQMKQVEDIRNGWSKAAEADPEVGGQGFKENVELARRAIERFGSEEFRKALDETGFGNHPEVIRTFVRIGKSMADDKLVHAKDHGAGDQKSAAELFYPSMAKQQ